MDLCRLDLRVEQDRTVHGKSVASTRQGRGLVRVHAFPVVQHNPVITGDLVASWMAMLAEAEVEWTVDVNVVMGQVRPLPVRVQPSSNRGSSAIARRTDQTVTCGVVDPSERGDGAVPTGRRIEDAMAQRAMVPIRRAIARVKSWIMWFRSA